MLLSKISGTLPDGSLVIVLCPKKAARNGQVRVDDLGEKDNYRQRIFVMHAGKIVSAHGIQSPFIGVIDIQRWDGDRPSLERRALSKGS